MTTRNKVLDLYKRLLFAGKDYPDKQFKTKLHAAFAKKKGLTNTNEIEKSIALGEYVLKEIEAFWFLKKYREMKKRYY